MGHDFVAKANWKKETWDWKLTDMMSTPSSVTNCEFEKSFYAPSLNSLTDRTSLHLVLLSFSPTLMGKMNLTIYFPTMLEIQGDSYGS